MHIGLVIYGSLDSVSGGYLYDRKLVEYLRRQGDQVSVVALPWRSYVRHLGDNFSFSFFRRLRDLDVDILLEDELNHPSLFRLNHRLKRQKRYPLVPIVHHLRSSEQDHDWRNFFFRRLEARFLNSADAFIFNSQATRQVVESLHPKGANLPQPWVVAYPAGDRFQPQLSLADITHRGGESGPLRLVFVGNLIPRKGLHILLQALKAFSPQELMLTVVGNLEVDPHYVERIRAQISDLGLAEQVRLLGALDDQALTDCLQTQHVLAVPSAYEGFGIVYLEGMGFGLPAIASTQGGAREIISSGENGFLIDFRDAERSTGLLVQCLDAFHRDRELLVQMSLAAYRRYTQHPGWQQTGKRIRLFLQNLLYQEG
jgi:glycosyltransferase involved in cell wall biosynthesis